MLIRSYSQENVDQPALNNLPACIMHASADTSAMTSALDTERLSSTEHNTSTVANHYKAPCQQSPLPATSSTPSLPVIMPTLTKYNSHIALGSHPTETPSQRATLDLEKESHSDVMGSHAASSGTTTSEEASIVGSTGPHLRIILAFVALSLSIALVALDTVIIPTALPTIALSFHIPDSLYAWIGSAYLLANAASVPFWGKLSDIFGRKPILLISNFIFLFGSIICAVSNSANMLVAGRTVQGLGGGGVVVLVHICVSDLFPIRDRAFYLATVGAVWAIASALGPVLGGVFAEKLGWRWCFYVNLPIIPCAITLTFFTLRFYDPKTNFFSGMASMDWLGTFVILSATVLLLVGLQLGSVSTYSAPHIILLLTLGSFAFVIFPFSQWWEENRARNPIMPLRIFKDINNLSALAVVACDALVFNAVAYFLPLYFQIVLGRNPASAGVYMLAIAIPLAIVSFASGHIIDVTGRFLEVLQLGLILMTVGVGLLISLGADPSSGKIIGFLIVIGIGFGPNFGAPLVALQTRIKPCDIAAGTSAFGFVRMVSGAIGVVVSQVVFQLSMTPHSRTFTNIGLSDEFAANLAGGDAISQVHAVATLPEQQRKVVRDSFSVALRGTWILCTVVSALGLLVSFGIKRIKLRREPKKPSSSTEDSGYAEPQIP